MRTLALLPALLAGCFFADLPRKPAVPVVDDPCAMWEAPGTYDMRVNHPEIRTARVHVPATAGPRTGLVFLHGATGSADRTAEMTTFVEQMQEHGLVVISPQGFGAGDQGGWNAGNCCGTADLLQIDDVAFLDTIAERAFEKLCVEDFVVVGHSNGGMMAHRWACESPWPSAVVSSAGPYLQSHCERGDVPRLLWHGTADEVVPLEGSRLFPPASEALEPLLATNDCAAAGDEMTWGELTCTTWQCAAPLTSCTVDGWPHKWPGARQGAPEGGLEVHALDWWSSLAYTRSDTP